MILTSKGLRNIHKQELQTSFLLWNEPFSAAPKPKAIEKRYVWITVKSEDLKHVHHGSPKLNYIPFIIMRAEWKKKIQSYLLYKNLYLKPSLPKKQNHIEKFPQTHRVQDREWELWQWDGEEITYGINDCTVCLAYHLLSLSLSLSLFPSLLAISLCCILAAVN